MSTASEENIIVVGIGASAGGLNALQTIMSTLPSDLEHTAIIIAQHLSPTHKSFLVELLGREAKYPVVQVKDKTPIQPAIIYITPPDSEIVIAENTMILNKPHNAVGPKPSVDVFFTSLASEYKGKAVGIILSGTGTDGARGVQALHAVGARTVVQHPKTAQYTGMPISAMNTKCVDLMLSPEEIGRSIHRLHDRSFHFISPDDEAKALDPIDQILVLLTKHTGIDFTSYKSASVLRRLNKRMEAIKVSNTRSYLHYLEEQPEEIEALFDYLLINVTAFFRDEEAFEIAKEQIQYLMAEKRQGEDMRIWVTACATGQEAYSIAVLASEINEALDIPLKVQIFATDVDKNALETARKGCYSMADMSSMPAQFRDKYFMRHANDTYEVKQDLRDMIMFAVHDLTNSAPFVKIDFLSCRNLLIYFGTSLQQQTLLSLHYALKPEGVLFLGKSENIGELSSLFSPIDNKNKFFTRINTKTPSAFSLPSIYNLNRQDDWIVHKDKTKQQLPTLEDRIKDTFYQNISHAYVVVNNQMNIVEVGADMKGYLTLGKGASNNVAKLANTDLQIDVRTVLSKAIKQKKKHTNRIRPFEFWGNTHYTRISAQPLFDSTPKSELYLLIFEDIGKDEYQDLFPDKPDGDAADSKYVLDLEIQLKNTEENLQNAIEELEVSNEELQSLNEELQSTNEELQSSNEELETANEELQSTNEELQVAYMEVRTSAEELRKGKKLVEASEEQLRTLLDNTAQAFLLISDDYKVINFNLEAYQYANSVKGKVLKIGDMVFDYFPSDYADKFNADLIKAFHGKSYREEVSFSRNGKQYWMEYIFAPIRQESTDKVSRLFLSIADLSHRRRAELEASALASMLSQAQQIGKIGSWEYDLRRAENKLVWSSEMQRMYGLTAKAPKNIEDMAGFYKKEFQRQMGDALQNLANTQSPFDMEAELSRGANSIIWVRSTGLCVRDEDNQVIKYLGIVQDISKAKEREKQLQDALATLKEAQVSLVHAEKMSSIGEVTAGLAHEMNNPINYIKNGAEVVRSEMMELKSQIDWLQVQIENHYNPQVRQEFSFRSAELIDTLETLEEMLHSIIDGSDRVTKIIKGLRNFSYIDVIGDPNHKDAMSKMPVAEIHKGINGTLTILEHKIATNGITLSKVFTKKKANVLCLLGQLNQVFMNLIGNAADSMDFSTEKMIEISTDVLDDEWLEFRVTDTGGGIPESIQDRIFDPFFTTKGVGKGTGLGLSISYNIVKQHGGQLICESEEGKGTTFIVRLPLYMGRQEE